MEMGPIAAVGPAGPVGPVGTGRISTNCIFGYSSGVIVIVSIITYLYFIILDYKDENYKERPLNKSIWIYGLFLLLLLSFFLCDNVDR